ncbi:4-aminobutyrate aminotransferase [Bordetella ansorpii]|uniref:4-aminobutyrate aminotransferase n=1 Tax=Bordetella ansorpii TaxID=288768 RepID=A0A157SPW5_9BORD|nr:4-aminobutyrate--2-oxoglutarate transaminase [Bordetella ansorpii]SAI72500.1 4-aminobutyrate aminotransferase [Bordetella ansorpii]
MKNQELNTRRAQATPRGVGVMCDFYAVRAENATLWDAEGREYIDFAGGIAVLNTGHLHPKVQAAVAAQLQQFTHTAYQIVPYEGYVALAERINALAPIDGPAKTAFFTTGAEAVENAVKIARSYTGRSGVIAFGGAFHGRTLLGMALTGKVAPYKLSFGPMPAEIFHAPFPGADVTVAESIKALEMLFKTDIDPKRVAAIILEPVQGEGGFNVAPPELMRELRRVCDEHGILLIADEVQTGFARTGKLFAMQHHDVKPDLMTIAKSLGGGMPISGVVGRAEVMDGPAPGGLGGTYAGNALSVAAALAVLDVIEEEKLCERSARLGEQLMGRLDSVRKEVPGIADVRGLGSMVAVELVDADGKPDAEAVKRVQARAMQQGLILLSCGVYGNVLRFLYPLTIPDAQFARALDILADALKG